MKKIFLPLLICYSFPSFAQKELEDKSFSFITTNFWLILAGLLFSILFILVFKAFQKIDDLNSLLKKTQKNVDNITPNTSPFSTQKNRVEDQITKLSERLHKLEIVKITTPQPIIQEEESREVIFHIPRKEPETSVFYMATPNGEKMFEMGGKSDDFIPTRSLYKFFVDASGDEASFEFNSDESGIKESANSPHLYIEPVCDPQNAQNPNAKNIFTVQKGTAEREGDKWIVKQKAKIEYR